MTVLADPPPAGARAGGDAGPPGFRAAARLVLDYLNVQLPLSLWSITRIENGRQTHLYLDENYFGLQEGDSHPWDDSFCVHMVAGAAPAIAPDTTLVPAYDRAPVNKGGRFKAYAGAPIQEPSGALFGVICGLDRAQRYDLVTFGPTLTVLSALLTVTLATDRALAAAEHASYTAHTHANTDALTDIHNRRAWDDTIARLDRDYAIYNDPTAIVVVDLDNLKAINDGPGGHTAGDTLLRTAADIMRSTIRDHDFLARLGGDEFGVILADCPATLAPTLAHRLGAALDRAGVPASVGWSPLLPDGTVMSAIQLADSAMFEAKRKRKGKR